MASANPALQLQWGVLPAWGLVAAPTSRRTARRAPQFLPWSGRVGLAHAKSPRCWVVERDALGNSLFSPISVRMVAAGHIASGDMVKSAFQAFLERLFSFGSQSTFDDWTVRLAAAVVVAFLAWLATRLLRWLAPRVAVVLKYAWQVRRALSAVAPESRGVWLSFPPRPPREYRRWLSASCPVWVCANLKGGVGKTTTAVESSRTLCHCQKQARPSRRSRFPGVVQLVRAVSR